MIVDVKSNVGLSEFIVHPNHKLINIEKIEDIEECKLIKALN